MSLAPASAPAGASPVALDRLSLNQISVDHASLADAVDGCARHGIRQIGLWRHKVLEHGVSASAQLVRDAGLAVSSLCRGGFFPAATLAERQTRQADNERAIEEAAELGAPLLVLVCGPAPDRDLAAARQMVIDGIAALLPAATGAGVMLGVEPLHPIYAGDRSVVVTLAQANTIAEQFPSDAVGVIVDAYHVWWDPAVETEIARAGRRICGFHVSDWLVPSPDPLLGRGMMGDGVIDLHHLRTTVDGTGYGGPIEVEILNRSLWQMPLDEALALIAKRFVGQL